MKKAIDLLDSKKFCDLLETLAVALSGEDDIEKAAALDAVFEAADGETVRTWAKAVGRRAPIMQEASDGFGEGMKAMGEMVSAPILNTTQKRKKIQAEKPKALDPDDDSPESKAKFFAQAEEARLATASQESVIQDFVDTEMQEHLKKGVRKFNIPYRWKGRTLSMNQDRWRAAIESTGTAINDMVWDFGKVPQGTPLPDDYMPLTLV